jgi:hypothetical protein
LSKKLSKSCQKVVKKVVKQMSKIVKKLSNSCQKVVTNFGSPGKNQKKVNRPENKNGNGNKKKEIIGIP